MEYWKAAGNNAAFHWEESMDSTPSLVFVELFAVGSVPLPVPDNPKLLLLKGRENVRAGKSQNWPFIETYISSLTRDAKNQFHQTYFF